MAWRTIINEVRGSWRVIKNHCRTTDNKDFTDKDPTDEWVRKLLISEHTPIRLREVDWSWKQIPYWLSTELSRHKFEKFISSQRDDRLPGKIPRGEKPQKAPVNFDGFANMQHLIDFARKRLCTKATAEAREAVGELKRKLHDGGYVNEAYVLVPNCIYRGGCPEFQSCGFYDLFAFAVGDEKLRDIQSRYDAFNEYFLDNRITITDKEENDEPHNT